MQKWGPFVAYANDELPGNVVSIKDAAGNDFYALRNSLTAADEATGAVPHTYLVTTEGGLVTVASDTVDVLFPQGMTLYQVDRLLAGTAAVGKVIGADGTLTAAPPIIPAAASKLGLVRALREKGDWATVKTALAANTDLQDDWDAAQSIARSDPLTAAMIATMKYSATDVDALLLRAAVLASA